MLLLVGQYLRYLIRRPHVPRVSCGAGFIWPCRNLSRFRLMPSPLRTERAGRTRLGPDLNSWRRPDPRFAPLRVLIGCGVWYIPVEGVQPEEKAVVDGVRRERED